MKEKLTFSLFVTIFIGSLIIGSTAPSLHILSFSIFVAGCSGAILTGALLKYFSQEERDLRDIKREKRLIQRSKQKKTATIKLSKFGANKLKAKK